MNYRKLLFATALSAISLFGTNSLHAQDSKPTFRLGVVLSASGGASSIGLPEKNGAAIAEKMISTMELPFDVEIVTYDDGSDPTKTANSVRRLLDEDKVHFIACCTTTPGSFAINDLLTEAKTAAITFAAANAVVEPAAERPFTYKASATDKMMIQRLIDEMKRRDITKVASLIADDSYGESGLRAMNELTAASDIEMVEVERVSRKDSNFTPQALRIKQSNPDVVYVHTYVPASYLVQAALRKVGYRGLIIQSQGSASAQFLKLGGERLDGTLVIVSPIVVQKFLDENYPGFTELREFARIYDAEYGEGKSDNYSAMGWDGVQIALKAFEMVAEKGVDTSDLEATRAAVHAALLEVKDLVTTSGPLDFSSSSHVGVSREVALPIAEVKGGTFTLFQP